MATDTIAALDKRIKELQARRAAVVGRERERERKRDTRRKVILGAGLLALVRKGDPAAEQVYGRVRAGLDAGEAKPFEGWEPPRDGGES